MEKQGQEQAISLAPKLGDTDELTVFFFFFYYCATHVVWYCCV